MEYGTFLRASDVVTLQITGSAKRGLSSWTLESFGLLPLPSQHPRSRAGPVFSFSEPGTLPTLGRSRVSEGSPLPALPG